MKSAIVEEVASADYSCVAVRDEVEVALVDEVILEGVFDVEHCKRVEVVAESWMFDTGFAAVGAEQKFAEQVCFAVVVVAVVDSYRSS